MKRAGWSFAVAAGGTAATVLGVLRLQDSEHPFSAHGVIDGIGSQIGSTLPSGVTLTLAFAVNVLTAALVLRVLRRRPFTSIADIVLHGFGAAVVLDTAVLMALGSAGVFRSDVLLVLHAVALAVAWRWGRPLLDAADVARHVDAARGPGIAIWVLIGVAWMSPVILSIASPVVPFADVLPNHVAPVEHVRTYGSFRELTTVPSPIYGPSRSFLGYIGLVSTASVMTGVEAVRTAAALIVPVTGLMLLSVYRFARGLAGRTVATFATLAVPLTVAFLRLPDLRSSAVSLSLALAALALALDRATADRTLGVATLLSAAVLVHPIIGGVAIVTVVLLGSIDAEHAKGIELVRAGCAALVVAVPQAVAMAGVDAPSWTFILSLPLAVVVGRGMPNPKPSLHTKTRRVLSTVVLAVAVVGVLPVLPDVVRGVRDTAVDVARFPLLLTGAIAAIVAARRRLGWLALLLLGLPFAAASVVRAVPGEGTAWGSMKFEVTAKIVEFWIPVMLALFTAAGLGALWSTKRWPIAGRVVVIAAIVVAAFPFGARNLPTAPVEEVRYSESLAIAFHHAENGYWSGYAHPYRLIDTRRRELVDAIRREQRAGRLRPDTEVLHVASSFQQWTATPLAVFTGVIETIASPDPEYSGHTLGGRLHHIDDLPQLLRRPTYGYVVAEGVLDADVAPDIRSASLTEVFSNGYATLYRRG